MNETNMRPAVVRVAWPFAFLTLWAFTLSAEDDGPLSLADLAAVRAALDPPAPGDPAPRPATFRDLWDHPDQSRGHRVKVVGRVERVFHQGAIGDFPALAEAWIVDKTTDPLCLVFPRSPAASAPKPGELVEFEGTFLRRIRYRGADVDRLAPLIVGSGPARVEPAAVPGRRDELKVPFEGAVVAILGVIVVLALLRAHLRRPVPPPIVDGPPPEFHDGEPDGYDGGRTDNAERG